MDFSVVYFDVLVLLSHRACQKVLGLHYPQKIAISRANCIRHSPMSKKRHSLLEKPGLVLVPAVI